MSDQTANPEPQKQPEQTPKADAIARRQGDRQMSLQKAMNGLLPESPGELMQLATILQKANCIPSANRTNPETVAGIILLGYELGLGPIRACQNIINIKGNLAQKSDLQLAQVRNSGLCEYYDEGYEERGVTDTDLTDEDRGVLHAKRILALVKNVPEGMPYGWATSRRKGDTQTHTRVFTWVDADRAFVYEVDETLTPEQQKQNRSRAEKKKLAEKFNYQAWPQSMYPRRARSQLFGFLYSDILAGLPSVEALEGGQVFDAQYSVEAQPAGPDVTELLAEIRAKDPEAADGIVAGIDYLKMSDGKALTLLLKHRDNPRDLYTWLRDEAAKRRGKASAAPPKRNGNAAPATAAAPADPPKPADPPPADVVDAQLVDDDEAREQAAADFVDGLDRVSDEAWDAANPDTLKDQIAEPAPAETVDTQAPEPIKPRSLADMVKQFQGKLQSF